MTGLGNIFQGLSGLASGGNQYYNPIYQSGGITGPQEDFTQYGYQENLLADASEFAGGGLSHSTMASGAAAGSRLGQAQEQGKISDTNAGAILQAGQIGEQAAAATNTTNQNDLSTLAQAATGLANQSNQQSSFNQGVASVTS